MKNTIINSFIILFFCLLFYMLHSYSEITKGINHKSGATPEEKAKEIEKRYQIAQIDNDEVALCVLSRLIIEEYKKANNPSKYKEWKEIESKNCN